MRHKKISARIASLVLTAAMVCTMLPATVLAAEGELDSGASSLGASSLTECHAAHDTACGYIAAGNEIPCSHLNEDGTYSCAPVADGAEASPSDADEEYVCPHDDDCGYAQAVEGAPCTHSCELCEVKDSGTPPIAPACVCTVKCLPADAETGTDAAINAECPVCSNQGADLSGCKGEAAMLTSTDDVIEVGTLEELQAALLIGGNIKLTADIFGEVSTTKSTAKEIVLDLGGHTLKGVENATLIYHGSPSTLTIKNGTIQGEDSATRRTVYVGGDDATINIMEDTTIIGRVQVDLHGTLNLSGGTIRNPHTIAIINWGTTNITGGLVTSAYSSLAMNAAGTICMDNAQDAVLNVSGGTVENTSTTTGITINGYLGKVTISGGEVTSSAAEGYVITGKSLTISDGHIVGAERATWPTVALSTLDKTLKMTGGTVESRSDAPAIIFSSATKNSVEISGGTVRSARGIAIGSGAKDAVLKIKSGSPIFQGGERATNIPLDLSTYAPLPVFASASANYDGSSAANVSKAALDSSLSTYKYLTFGHTDVTDITSVPAKGVINEPLTLSGTTTPVVLQPAIVWSLGIGSTATGAKVQNGQASATGIGTVVVKATVAGAQSDKSDFTKEFTINFAAEATRYDVTYALTNLTAASQPAKVIEGSTLDATLTAAAEYNLPATIAVTMGGNTLTLNNGYTYNRTTGAVSVPNVTGAVVITATGDKAPVPVTGVTLNKTSLSLYSNAEPKTETLTATVAPANATNKAVTWHSNSTNIVTVDANGKVSAVNGGTATITATTADGKKTATCVVNVSIYSENVPVTGVTLNKTSLSLYSNTTPNTETLTATVAPTNVSNKAVTWASGNTSVATVDANGKVTAVANGTATITATTADGGKTATCTVTVSTYSSGGGSTGGGGGGGSSSGGGGSSSSGGGSTVVTPPSTPDKPNPPATAESKVEAKVDTNGNVAVSVPEKSVTDAIKAAQDAAKKAGTTDNGIAVTLNVETSTAASSISATLPQAAVAELVKAGTTELKIESKTADITLDLAAMKQVQAAGDGSVTVSANKVSSSGLSQAAQAAIGSRPVFNLSIKNGSKVVSSFGAGSVSVALPYTLGANEKAGNVCGVYVDDAGKVTYLTNSSYDANSKTLLFSTNHFSTFGIGYKADAPAFTDTTGHWAKADIDFVVSRGMLSGTSATTFSPNSPMTRAMYVTALGRLAGIDVNDYKTNQFTDVKADAYYVPYANWAASKGIISDTTATTFSPDKRITRQQMAVMMSNYAKVTGYSIPKVREAITFVDNADISSWAASSVKQMQMAGVLNGKDGNHFDPDGAATRAEASAVLRRYVELVIDSATAQGLDTNDSGSTVMYESGKLVKSASRTVNSTTYSFNANGEAALPVKKQG